MVTRRISGPRREFPSGDAGTRGIQCARLLYEDYYENFYENPPGPLATFPPTDKIFPLNQSENSVIHSTSVQRPEPTLIPK